MSQDQVLGALRIILPTLLAYAAGAGFISQSSIPEVTTALVTLAATVWSVIAHTKKNIVAAAAALPEVNKVEVVPTVAGKALKKAVEKTPNATVTIATGL